MALELAKDLKCNKKAIKILNIKRSTFYKWKRAQPASKNLAHSNFKGGFIESDPNQKPFRVEIGFTTNDVEATVKKQLKQEQFCTQNLKQNLGDK